MSFQTRDEFVNAQESEKITLAHIHATTRLVNWTNLGGDIYYKDVTYFVTECAQDTTNLTQVFTLGDMVEGSFFYDIQLSRLYVWGSSSEDLNDQEIIPTYRFFFASGPCTVSWNLENDGDYVYYDGRVSKSPGYKHKIGIDQQLTSLVGSGTLILDNNDGHFDDIFDAVFFENQKVSIYSWNRQLDFSEAKIIFRGRVTNKTFSSEQITLTIKDTIFDLEQSVPQGVFDDSDTVNDNVKGNYKRWVYGRADGMQLQSIDQIGDGYLITGTVSGNPSTTTITGTGTIFLTEISPEDTLTVGLQEFTVSSVTSDTTLEVSDEPRFSFTSLPSTLNPEIPTVTKNREFFITDHAGAKLTKTVVDIVQFNRIQVSDVDGILVGDFIEFESGERIQVKDIAPNNIVVLQQNIVALPSVGSDVIRQPVQSAFIGSARVNPENFTLTNTTAGLSLTFDSDTEFNLATIKGLVPTFTFTNGSRIVTSSTGEDLTNLIKVRDWIRPANIAYTTFYEVLSVSEAQVEIRTVFGEATISDTGSLKSPNYIGDETIVSADVLGRTVDGTPDGVWISKAPQAITDLLTQIGITDINTASFTQGEIDSPQIISLPIPLSPGSSLTTVKTVVDALNLSTRSSVTLDNSLDIKYTSLLVKIPDDLDVITDREVINWSIKATNGNVYRNAVVRYRHKDVDRYTLEPGNSVVTYTSPFVQKYIKTDKSNEIDVRLYNATEAQIRAHRETYYSRLSRTEITVDSDLRLDKYEIGDSVRLDFRRLYKRFGNTSDNNKIVTIIGKTVDGEKVSLTLSDVGNVYNSSSIITPNTAVDYSTSTDLDKIKYGYITDTQGIIDDLDETSNTHLIS